MAQSGGSVIPSYAGRLIYGMNERQYLVGSSARICDGSVFFYFSSTFTHTSHIYHNIYPHFPHLPQHLPKYVYVSTLIAAQSHVFISQCEKLWCVTLRGDHINPIRNWWGHLLVLNITSCKHRPSSIPVHIFI